ncbi:MAG: alpha-D-ribose 1-methylphosphonate 5-triphosphate diphosphatase [Granulosicoccus sp.]|nr:alpha-D-ribose 1-methylphosphonate 5-triphosphate diphosphatase [Granulosicoccus sp.]
MDKYTGSWCLANGAVLRPDGFCNQPLYFDRHTISKEHNADTHTYDATGLYVLPGIVDVHGDGFERNISPRNGVFFDLEDALLETDQQLLFNGITSAFLAMTISWEPGLRSLSMAKQIVASLQRLLGRFSTDIRLQLRWEIVAIEAVPSIIDWFTSLSLPTLAINDHYTQLLSSNKAHKVPEYARRAGLSETDYLSQMQHAIDRPDAIDEACNAVIKAAKQAGVSIYSHDETDVSTRQSNRALGITVCEFPLTKETAQEARLHHEPVILGAPNVVRGGSHIGAMDATSAIEQNLCTVLASDYHYPTLLNAITKLAKGDVAQLATLWPLISDNPATASQLKDRGQLVAGKRADALALSMTSGNLKIEAVFVGGKPVYIADLSRLSLQ